MAFFQTDLPSTVTLTGGYECRFQLEVLVVDHGWQDGRNGASHAGGLNGQQTFGRNLGPKGSMGLVYLRTFVR